jgi:hypothetical protein
LKQLGQLTRFVLKETEAYVRLGFEYDEFLRSLKRAKDVEDIYIPYAYTELTVLKDFGYRITETQVWGETSVLSQLIMKYYSNIDSKINRFSNDRVKNNTQGQGKRGTFSRR